MPLQIRPRPQFVHPLTAIFSSTDSLIKVVVPLYSLHLGLSLASVGALVSLTAVARIVLRMAVGRLTDHFGESVVCRAGGICLLLAPVGLFLSPRFGVSALVATQLLMGVTYTIYWTVSKVYVSKMPGKTGKNIGLYSGSSQAGQLLGLTVSGTLVVALGYTTTFTVISVLATLFCLGTFTLPSLTPPPTSRFALRSLLQILPQGLDLRSLSVAGLCACVSAAPAAMVASFFPVYISYAGYSKQTVGLLLTLVTIGTMLASGWSHQRLDRTDNLRLVNLVGTSGIGVVIAVLPAFHGWLPLAFIFLATGFMGGICDALYQMLVRLYSPLHVRGTAMAYAGLIRGFAILIMPIGTGLIASWLSLPLAFVVLGGCFMVLGLLVSPHVRKARTQTAAASALAGGHGG